MEDKKDESNKPKINKDTDTSMSEPLVADTVEDRLIPLTHEKCIEFLESMRFEGEREVSDSHVQRLYDEWKCGRFNWDQVLIATAHISGKPDEIFHINGQHTCWARLNMPKNTAASVRWCHYKVPDEANLRRLYGGFDRNKSRSPGHVLKSLLVGSDAVNGVWASEIEKYGASLRFWLFEKTGERKRVGPDETADLMSGKHAQLLSRVAVFVQKNNKYTHMRKQAIIGAIFATSDKQPGKMNEFWQPVADGLNMTSNSDPRFKLRELLMTAKQELQGSQRQSRKFRLMSPEDMYRCCISCWNKWRKGESLPGSLRPPDRRYVPV